MSKKQLTSHEVKELYENSSREIARWMWNIHVQWVANRAVSLAEKYGADSDKVYVGALLHDLGDIWLERDDEQFEKRSEREARKILSKAGFTPDEIEEIVQDIIEPHSCYPNNLPETLEGKCLATADGLFHLVTDFFPQFGWMNIPKSKTYNEWIDWVTEKIDRDLNDKIFFDDEKTEALPYYEALKRVYVR